MPRYRIVSSVARSVELPGGVELFADVAGREEAVVAESPATLALVASGAIVVIDPDAPPPDVPPTRDPLYQDRATGDFYANLGGGAFTGVPFGGTRRGAWAPLTFYRAEDMVVESGAFYTRDAPGVSRAAFDATERALWTATGDAASPLALEANAPAEVPLKLIADPGQSVPVFEVYDTAGVRSTRIEEDGDLFADGVGNFGSLLQASGGRFGIPWTGSPANAPEAHFYGQRGAHLMGGDVANNGGGGKDWVPWGKINPGFPSVTVADTHYNASNDLIANTTVGGTLPQSSIDLPTAGLPSSGSGWIMTTTGVWQAIAWTTTVAGQLQNCSGGTGAFASGAQFRIVKAGTIGLGVTPPGGAYRVYVSGADSEAGMGGIGVRRHAGTTGRPFEVYSDADGRVRQGFGVFGGVLVGGDPDLQASGGVNFLNALNVEGGASGSVNCAIWRSSNRTLLTDAVITLPSAVSTDTFPVGLRIGQAIALTGRLQQGFDADGSLWIGHNAYYASGTRKWETTSGADGSRGVLFSRISGISFYANALASTADTATTPSRRLQITNVGNVNVDPDGLGGKLQFATDATANLYLGSAGSVKTDGNLDVAGARFRHAGTFLGFYGAAAINKPAVAGSRAGNAALASLLTALANLGLVTDGSGA